jgi:hypothetical protein
MKEWMHLRNGLICEIDLLMWMKFTNALKPHLTKPRGLVFEVKATVDVTLCDHYGRPEWSQQPKLKQLLLIYTLVNWANECDHIKWLVALNSLPNFFKGWQTEMFTSWVFTVSKS